MKANATHPEIANINAKKTAKKQQNTKSEKKGFQMKCLSFFRRPTPSGLDQALLQIFLILWDVLCIKTSLSSFWAPRRHGKAQLATQQDSQKPKGDASGLEGVTAFPSDEKGLILVDACIKESWIMMCDVNGLSLVLYR